MSVDVLRLRDELNKWSDLIQEAKRTGKIVVAFSFGDHRETEKPKDPYPLFFNHEEFLETLTNGHWHCVEWYLEDKKVIQKSILNRIKELQDLLVKL